MQNIDSQIPISNNNWLEMFLDDKYDKKIYKGNQIFESLVNDIQNMKYSQA